MLCLRAWRFVRYFRAKHHSVSVGRVHLPKALCGGIALFVCILCMSTRCNAEDFNWACNTNIHTHKHTQNHAESIRLAVIIIYKFPISTQTRIHIFLCTFYTPKEGMSRSEYIYMYIYVCMTGGSLCDWDTQASSWSRSVGRSVWVASDGAGCIYGAVREKRPSKRLVGWTSFCDVHEGWWSHYSIDFQYFLRIYLRVMWCGRRCQAHMEDGVGDESWVYIYLEEQGST